MGKACKLLLCALFLSAIAQTAEAQTAGDYGIVGFDLVLADGAIIDSGTLSTFGFSKSDACLPRMPTSESFKLQFSDLQLPISQINPY